MSKYYKCPKCGLELSFEEVCKSTGHNCDELEKQESVLCTCVDCQEKREQASKAKEIQVDSSLK